VQLAIACGVAGLAFGAFMDVYQWTLAARQDLATYVTVSASSLPYNLAHAIGNVVFCLLIGPVFIRSLSRYKRRFEVRWAPALGAAATLVLVAVLVAAPAAVASPASRATAYLKSVQNRDGGFGGAKGQGSAQLISGWVALGLESAGVNPRQVKRPHGRSVTSYLGKGAKGLRDTGELERTIIVLAGAKLNPRRFAGRDLVAELLRRRHADGSWGPNVGWTAFAVFALRATGFSTGSSTVAAAGKWLGSVQNDDGGFGYIPTSESDADDTGAVLQALGAAGQGRAGAAVKAVAYLRKTQNRDGGWGQMLGRSSNTQSTAWVVQGMVAAGVAPASLDGATRFILGLQRRDGHIRYSRSSDQTPAWVTAQAVTALKRKPFPLAPAPLKRVAKHSSVAAAPAPAAAPPSSRTKAHGSSKPKRRVPSTAAPAHATTTAVADKPRLDAKPASGAATSTGGGPSGWLLVLASVAALCAVLAGRWWFHRRRSQPA
jgi:hypothetical protein